MMIDFDSVYTYGVIGSTDYPNHTEFIGYCKNVFADLDGTIRPHKFPKSGLWKFDGQVFYLPRSKK